LRLYIAFHLCFILASFAAAKGDATMTAPVIEPGAFNPLKVTLEISKAQTPRLSPTDDVPREWLRQRAWWAITLRIGPFPSRGAAQMIGEGMRRSLEAKLETKLEAKREATGNAPLTDTAIAGR
jgi:hypothetical protein